MNRLSLIAAGKMLETWLPGYSCALSWSAMGSISLQLMSLLQGEGITFVGIGQHCLQGAQALRTLSQWLQGELALVFTPPAEEAQVPARRVTEDESLDFECQ